MKKNLLFCLCFVLAISAVQAAAIGTYKIPSRVDFAGTTIEPGMYAVEIVEGSEGPYIQLSKGGEAVQKDLAIVIPASSSVSRPQVQIAKLAGQEFVRIRIRQDSNYYYVYLKTIQ